MGFYLEPARVSRFRQDATTLVRASQLSLSFVIPRVFVVELCDAARACHGFASLGRPHAAS
jgi:hypothetical protein